MRYLLFLLTCLSALGQPFTFNDVAPLHPWLLVNGVAMPVTGLAIETNGSFANLYFSATAIPAAGTYTNGDGGFQFGFNTNGIMTNLPFVTLTVTSPTILTNGSSNILTRTIYATTAMRKVYGEQTNVDAVLINGTNLAVRLALSETIIANDFGITGSLLANFYSNSVAYTLSVTNGSTIADTIPKAWGKMTMPDWEVINTSTYTCCLFGVQGFATGGKPLSGVIVTFHDEHLHTNYAVSDMPTTNYSSAIGDGSLSLDYAIPCDMSTMTEKDKITFDVRYLPIIGTTNTMFDTSLGWAARGTPFPHTYVSRLNKNRTWASAYALVATNGNDATGYCTTTNFNIAGNPPNPFQTWSAAFTALKGTNNTVSNGTNNTCAGGVIYLVQGDHAITLPPDDTMDGFVYVDSYRTNTTRPAITNGVGSGRSGSCIAIRNCAITAPASVSFCLFNWKAVDIAFNFLNSACSTFVDKGDIYYRGNIISNWATGLIPPEQFQPITMLRGNKIYCKQTGLQPTLMHGNYYNDNTSFGVALVTTSQGASVYQCVDYGMMCFNQFWRINSSAGSQFSYYGGTDCLTNGFIQVQNLYENIGPLAVSMGFGADGATGGITNAVSFNETHIGNWQNTDYSDNGSSPIWRVCIFRKGNIWTAHHIKSDTYTGTPNAGRIGDWPCLFGVNFQGNFDVQETNVTFSGGVIFDFPGMNSYQPPRVFANTTYWQCMQNPTNFIQFNTNKAAMGGNSGSGGGDYHLKSTSPAVAAQGFRTGWYGIPYDFDGAARSTNDPPGVYVTTR